MITISSGLRSLLASQHYNIYTKIKAYAPDYLESEQVDLSGRLISGRISASMDDNARAISLVFERGQGATSLSPLMAGSIYNTPKPLLGSGNIVDVFIAIMAPGVAPVDADYFHIEQMRIDSWSAPDKNQVEVSGRDFVSARLLDLFIEMPTAYGPGLAETVMNQIIVDWWGPGLAGTIQLPSGASSFMLNKYAQQEQTIMEALKTIALQIGWDYRAFPRYLSDDPLKTAFYDPGRARTTPDAIIGLSEYTKMVQLNSDDADLRNVVQVWWGQDTTRNLAESINADSVTQYGRRFMRIVEEASSNIDTEVEAQAMADAACADTSTPFATHGVSTFLWPFVELNDLHQYPANDDHYDSDQTFAVVAYEHTFAAHSGKTVLTTRGKPIAAYRRWRKGTPAKVIVSTLDPPADTIAPENTIWVKVANDDFPV